MLGWNLIWLEIWKILPLLMDRLLTLHILVVAGNACKVSIAEALCNIENVYVLCAS